MLDLHAEALRVVACSRACTGPAMSRICACAGAGPARCGTGRL